MGAIIVPTLAAAVAEKEYGEAVWIECPMYQAPIGGRCDDASWITVQTKDPDVWGWSIGEQTRVLGFGASYRVQRYGIIWDTTGIPIGSKIVSAYMHRYGFNTYTFPEMVDHYIYWLAATEWGGGVLDSDYALFNSLTEKLAAFWATKEMITRGWHDIDLTSLGLKYINVGGLTKMVSITDVDYDNTDPGNTYRRFYWYGIAVEDKPQILHVEYKPLL